MTDVDKTTFLRQVEDLALQDPGDARDDGLSELIVNLVDADPASALLVLWDRLSIERDTVAARSLSFAMARHAEAIGVGGCPVLSTFLSSPVISDDATLLNTIGAIGLVDPENPVQVGVLQADLGDFVLKCLERRELPIDSVVNVLLRLADLDLLTRVMSSSQAATIRTRLSVAVAAVDSALVKDDWKALDAVLTGEFPQEVRVDREAIETAIKPSGAWPAATGWGSVLEAAVQSGIDALRDILLLQDASTEVRETATAVHQLHLSGANTAGGRLAIAAYARLLSAWRRLFETAFGVVEGSAAEAPQHPQLSMFVLAPQRSSFVIRVTVDAQGRDDLAARAFARAVEVIQFGHAEGVDGPRRDAFAGSVEKMYSVLDTQQLDLTIAMDTPGAQLRRARTRLSHTAATRAMGGSRRAPVLLPERQVVTGTLEAANHRTGQVEIGSPSQPTLRCDLQQGKRGNLLNRVIGREYLFTIEPRPDYEQPRWALISIDAIDEVEAGIEDAAIVSTSDDRLTSELVPQQDRLDKVIDVVRLIAAAKPVTPKNLGMEDKPSSFRHINYMKHAAKILRLLADTGTLLSAGRTLVTLAEHRALEFLALQFEATPVGHAWLKWAGVEDVGGLDPTDAPAFLREQSVLPESMIDRRGRTLRKWVQAFQAKT